MTFSKYAHLENIFTKTVLSSNREKGKRTSLFCIIQRKTLYTDVTKTQHGNIWIACSKINQLKLDHNQWLLNINALRKKVKQNKNIKKEDKQ